MRKLLIIALMAILAFSAFAQGASEKKAEEGPITLEWWTWDTGMIEQNQSIIAQYEATHPNVKINNTVIATDGGAYKTQLSVLAQQKALPDVFMLSSGDIEEWASNGLCRKLDDLVASDPDIYKKFYESMFTSLKDVAKTDYLPGFPFAYVSCDLFYNKDAFDAAGLEYPNENWTWDDFLAAAKALTIDKNGDGEIDQWGYYGYGRYAEAQAWIFANGGVLTNNTTHTFEPNQNALDAIQFMSDLVNVYKVAPSPKDMSAIKYKTIFPNQIVAMFVDGGWFADDFRKNIGDKFQWGITRVPVGPNGQAKVTYGWPDSYVISPFTEHAQAAWKFTKYIAGEGIGLDQFMAGKMPAYKALVESDAFVDMTQQPYGDMQLFRDHASDTFVTSYTQGWSEWVGYGAAESMGLNGAIDSILNGETTLAEVLPSLTESINKILSRYY